MFRGLELRYNANIIKRNNGEVPASSWDKVLYLEEWHS